VPQTLETTALSYSAEEQSSNYSCTRYFPLLVLTVRYQLRMLVYKTEEATGRRRQENGEVLICSLQVMFLDTLN